MIIDEFQPIWQRSRQDRWQEPYDPSHGAYLRWWLEHHGDGSACDTIGCRVERYSGVVRRIPWAFLRANRDLFTFYDRALTRFWSYRRRRGFATSASGDGARAMASQHRPRRRGYRGRNDP